MSRHEKPGPTGESPYPAIAVEPGVTYGSFPETTGEYPDPAITGVPWDQAMVKSGVLSFGSVHHVGVGVAGGGGGGGGAGGTTGDSISTSELMEERAPRDAAFTFLRACGLEPTSDAVGQLVEAFLPCLRKMCDSDHPWDPDGGTWRESGSMGALTDIRKKFKRLWYRAWSVMSPHNDPAAVDSAVDLINFIGFWLRSNDDGWNEWGEPGSGKGDV